MNYPSIEQVIESLGKSNETSELNSLFSTLQITTASLKKLHRELNDYKSWSDQNSELMLEFQDANSLGEIPYQDIEEGPWILISVSFWAIGKGVKKPYGGLLPYGIKFDMDRDAVKSLVPKSLFIEEKNIDVWQLDGIELIVDYDTASKKIRCVSLSLPPPTFPE